MVAVMSSNPTGGSFFFLLFKTPDVNFVQKCQICVEKQKNPNELMFRFAHRGSVRNAARFHNFHKTPRILLNTWDHWWLYVL